MTVDKYAEKLGMELYWRKNNRNSFVLDIKDMKDTNNNVKNEYRKLWLESIENNTDKSKAELRKLNSRIYTWLYRNDKEWFDKHTIKMPKWCKIEGRVNWKERDKEVLTEAMDII